MILLLTTLSLSGLAFAHGNKARHSAVDDKQMKKLHTIMPMFSVALASLEAALKKGDSATAEKEANKIITAVPDLKKSRPHKNVTQQKMFAGLAHDLENAVNLSVRLAKKGDFTGAKSAFSTAEEICVACHAKFRDD